MPPSVVTPDTETPRVGPKIVGMAEEKPPPIAVIKRLQDPRRPRRKRPNAAEKHRRAFFARLNELRGSRPAAPKQEAPAAEAAPAEEQPPESAQPPETAQPHEAAKPSRPRSRRSPRSRRTRPSRPRCPSAQEAAEAPRSRPRCRSRPAPCRKRRPLRRRRPPRRRPTRPRPPRSPPSRSPRRRLRAARRGSRPRSSASVAPTPCARRCSPSATTTASRRSGRSSAATPRSGSSPATRPSTPGCASRRRLCARSRAWSGPRTSAAAAGAAAGRVAGGPVAGRSGPWPPPRGWRGRRRPSRGARPAPRARLARGPAGRAGRHLQADDPHHRPRGPGRGPQGARAPPQGRARGQAQGRARAARAPRLLTRIHGDCGFVAARLLTVDRPRLGGSLQTRFRGRKERSHRGVRLATKLGDGPSGQAPEEVPQAGFGYRVVFVQSPLRPAVSRKVRDVRPEALASAGPLWEIHPRRGSELQRAKPRDVRLATKPRSTGFRSRRRVEVSQSGFGSRPLRSGA